MENQNGHCGKCANSQGNEPITLSEEQLDGVSGGGATVNRYNAEICRNRTKIRFYCRKGHNETFTMGSWCDHFRESHPWTDDNGFQRRMFSCVMNAFPPYSCAYGYETYDPE